MRTQKHILLIWCIALLSAGLLIFGSLADGFQIDPDLFLPIFLVYIAVGSLVAARHPENAIGWLFLSGAFFHSANVAMGWYANMGLQEQSVSLPGADVVAAMKNGMGNIGFGLLVVPPLLLFPNGHLLSRRWRPVLWLAILDMVLQILETFHPGPLAFFPDWENPLGIELLAGYFEISLTLDEILTTVLFIAGPLSLILRYRRSPITERQQIKWVAYTAGFVALVIGLMLVITPLVHIDEIWFNLIWILLISSIPISIGVAILRYHLWDVDLIIRRTLVYTALTAALALVYFGLVILLEGLLRSLVGSSGQVATVISTLAIAALFTPLRRRVQEVIDRRFYRRKYNAEQALAEFAATARAGTDLKALTAQMVGIVQKTMQSEQVSLWLKEK